MVSKQWSITSCGEFQSSNAQSGEFSSYLTHAVVSFPVTFHMLWWDFQLPYTCCGEFSIINTLLWVSYLS